jgi:hypothetical protein
MMLLMFIILFLTTKLHGWGRKKVFRRNTHDPARVHQESPSQFARR